MLTDDHDPWDTWDAPEPPVDYTKLGGPALLAACGGDARKWAEAFCQTAAEGLSVHLDAEWVATWFANAIMNSIDLMNKENRMLGEADSGLGKWMEISTAPRDGRPLIGAQFLDDGVVFVETIHWGEDFRDDEAKWLTNEPAASGATHWTLMPEGEVVLGVDAMLHFLKQAAPEMAEKLSAACGARGWKRARRVLDHSVVEAGRVVSFKLYREDEGGAPVDADSLTTWMLMVEGEENQEW